MSSRVDTVANQANQAKTTAESALNKVSGLEQTVSELRNSVNNNSNGAEALSLANEAKNQLKQPVLV